MRGGEGERGHFIREEKEIQEVFLNPVALRMAKNFLVILSAKGLSPCLAPHQRTSTDELPRPFLAPLFSLLYNRCPFLESEV